MTNYLHDFRYMSRDCLCRHWTKLLGLGLQTTCHVLCVQIRKALTDLTFNNLFGKREVSTGHHNTVRDAPTCQRSVSARMATAEFADT